VAVVSIFSGVEFFEQRVESLMSRESRPVSPHLQVYRWQVSNTLSILHRVTGVGLTLGGLVIWALGSPPSQLLLVGWTFCFFFHLCNGLRHLAWDADYGFDRVVARRSGIAVLVASVILTGVFWFVALTGALV
jgi:succinate dehydrogenase / fumarate reductase cytochrome b subunit